MAGTVGILAEKMVEGVHGVESTGSVVGKVIMIVRGHYSWLRTLNIIPAYIIDLVCIFALIEGIDICDSSPYLI